MSYGLREMQIPACKMNILPFVFQCYTIKKNGNEIAFHPFYNSPRPRAVSYPGSRNHKT